MNQPSGMNQPMSAASMTVADFTTRILAWVIDGVIIGIANYIVNAILFNALVLSLGGLYVVLQALVIAAISAGYFIYFWTMRKATPGMIVMKLEVVKDGTGAALTQSEAIRRWLYLGLPLALGTLISTGAGFVGGFVSLAILFTLALLVAVLSIAWEVYLLYMTNNDARKQGPHDKAVGSLVVAVGPSPIAGMGQKKP